MKQNSKTRTELPGSPWAEFSEDGEFYNITEPATPCPWYNYLYTSDGKFHLAVSQRGKGDSFYTSPRANLVSKGRNYAVVAEDGSWSLNGGFASVEPDKFLCRHAPGKTIFETERGPLESEITVAVDPDDYIEVNKLCLSNKGEHTLKFSLIGVNEVSLEGIDNKNQIERSFFDESTGAVLAKRYHYRTCDYKYAAFYVCNRKPESWCGARYGFYSSDVSYEHLNVWKSGVLPNIPAYATEPLFALQHNIVLEAGQKLVLYYTMGLGSNINEVKSKSQKFRNENQVEKSLKANGNYFSGLVKGNKLETPCKCIDTCFNTWTKIQLHRQVISWRMKGLFNWRNNLQDCWGWLLFAPEPARKAIKDICSLAKEDGFMPRSSPRVPELDKDDPHLFQKHTDIATWAGMLAGQYAAETGDLELFKSSVRYAGGSKTSTVIDRLLGGLRWLFNHRGKNGMILLLEGDWSDPLEEAGRKGIGESPWTSSAFVYASKNLIPVLEALDMKAEAAELYSASEELAKAVNQSAWDGEWYIRGITDSGVRFCTSDDPDAKVSLMMQAWPIISGIVPDTRLSSVLRACDEYIETPIGPILYGTPFMKVRPELGRETVKQPGTGENGSCYVHAGMMLAMAEVIAGRSDKALDIIKKILPLRNPDCTEITRSIPLWMPNFWHGPHSETPGLGSGIISTGAPAWFYLVVVQGFLGIKSELNGLRIEPALPSEWDNVKIERQWRGHSYNIEYICNSEIEEVKVELNGTILTSPVLPVPENNEISQVKVYIPKKN